tara:strand:- start:3467 stop:3871 length:405 start_codon:yes stop_codon:yes gene_type:complete
MEETQSFSEYVTDFQVRKSYVIFGTKDNPKRFGIDIEIDSTQPFPKTWKNYNENTNCDYIAYVTYTSHQYPNYHIELTWNISPNIDILENQPEYMKINKEIDNFCEFNEEKILSCARVHFNVNYPKLILGDPFE